MDVRFGSLNLASGKTMVMLGFALCLLVNAALTFSHMSDTLSRKILDAQFEYLRTYHPQPAIANDVVIVGIDEAALKSYREPYALWHPHFAGFLAAMARAQPSVVGMDVVLPDRSFDFLIFQYDQALMRALAALQTKVVLGQTMDENGNFRTVYAPFVEAVGATAPAPVITCPEWDGVVRRIDPAQCTVNARGATIAEAMAFRLGSKETSRGLVNFAVGEPFNYIPLHEVLEWGEQGNDERLRETFYGRPVLLGTILPSRDRVNLPVALAAWEPENRHLPEVVWHAQALRSMLDRGLLKEPNAYVVLALSFLAALLWFARLHWWKFIVLGVFPVVLLVLSTWQLARDVYLPVGGILFSGLFSFSLRSLYELILKARANNQLRGIFGNYVSAETLRAMIAGKVQSRLEGERKKVCIVYVGLHDINTRSVLDLPQELVNLLNDFFSEMTIAIHQHGGTVGKLMGDAVLAYFGAPQPLDNPEKNALEAAQEMLLRVRQINARLKERGLAPVVMGIGLHVGEVVIGHIGPETRHEYTALGKVVAQAARMQQMTQTLGYPIVCSRNVAERVEFSGGLADLGEQALGEEGSLPLCGWYPPLLAAN